MKRNKKIIKYVLNRLKTITPVESFVLVTMIAIVIFLVKFFKIKETNLKVRVQVWDYSWSSQINPYGHRLPHWKSNQLQIGQKEYDTQGKVIAEVINIDRFAGDAEGDEVYLDLNLKVDYNKITRQYSFKNKNVNIDGIIEVEVDNIFLNCLIINNNIEKNNIQEVQMETVWKNIRLRFNDASAWTTNKLNVGQKTFDTEGNILAEIVNIEKYEIKPEFNDIYLDIKVRTIYDKRSNQYLYKNNALYIGNNIEMQFDNVAVRGEIIDFDSPSNAYKKKEIIITGRWFSTEPWQRAQMKIGEKMINQANNQTVAEILKFYYENIPNNVFVFDQTGEISIIPHQLQKNVIFTIKLNGFEYDNKLYFAGHQRIKVGDSITIYGTNLTYYITVQRINQIKDQNI